MCHKSLHKFFLKCAQMPVLPYSRELNLENNHSIFCNRNIHYETNVAWTLTCPSATASSLSTAAGAFVTDIRSPKTE